MISHAGRFGKLQEMWTRERWLSFVEIAGFLSLSMGVAGFGWLYAGPVGAGASGLLAAGGCAVYLANAYGLTPDEEPDHAER